jgi:hypothetical protein
MRRMVYEEDILLVICAVDDSDFHDLIYYQKAMARVTHFL